MNQTKEEKTVIIIKPDGVKKKLIGEIISRIEKKGLRIIAMKMVWATKKQIDGHYPKDKVWIKRLGEKLMKNYEQHKIDTKKKLGTDDLLKIGKMVRGWLVNFMTSGPIVIAVISGDQAIDTVRKIVGDTTPSQARKGTIRGDFSNDNAFIANRKKRAIRNIIHASETRKEANHELQHWFSLLEGRPCPLERL